MNALSPVFDGIHSAMLLYQQGRLVETEALCRQILQVHANHPGALHLLGIISLQTGRVQLAIELLRQSLEANPNQAFALANLGAALLSLKRSAEALECCDRAVRLAPDSAQALYNRGTALLALKRSEEACASFERALRLQPDHVEALNNRGSALRALHRHAEALECYEHVLRLKPNVPETLSNRGSALAALHRHAEALESYDRALQLRADFPEALNGRGMILHVLQRHLEALESYERALRLAPDFLPALNGRGNALLALKRPAEALASYDEALRLRPDFAEAYSNRGTALRHLQRFDAALESFERSIQLGEDRPEALGNYGWALLEAHRYEAATACFARLLAVAPEYDYVRGAVCNARLACCDWADLQESVAAILERVRADQRVIAPFSLLLISDSPALNLRCARACVAHKYPASQTPAWRGRRYKHDRIRVAYVSPDLRSHVVAYLLSPLIERHDRGRFETIAISLRPAEQTPAGERIRAAFDRFHDVSSLTDDEVAALMCDLEIDIAVDIAGFTRDQRPGIFARRAAPVQVSYLGYPGSTGADYIDYLLADSTVIPEESRSCYAEKVVYLPDCYQVNHAERAAPAHAVTRAVYGLPDESFVFCCFNASFKITPPTFDIWMRLLHNVEGSVLWLAAQQASVIRNLQKEACDRGVAPERLIFAAHKAHLDEHLTRYALADLFLDTLPFNAHATAGDALWYGLPVLTCAGKAFAGRVAASLLHAVGAPELITESLIDYERRALELATTPSLLAELRGKLIRNRSTHALFDTDRFRRHLESAYLAMWTRYQRSEPPDNFTVPVTD